MPSPMGSFSCMQTPRRVCENDQFGKASLGTIQDIVGGTTARLPDHPVRLKGTSDANTFSDMDVVVILDGERDSR